MNVSMFFGVFWVFFRGRDFGILGDKIPQEIAGIYTAQYNHCCLHFTTFLRINSHPTGGSAGFSKPRGSG